MTAVSLFQISRGGTIFVLSPSNRPHPWTKIFSSHLLVSILIKIFSLVSNGYKSINYLLTGHELCHRRCRRAHTAAGAPSSRLGARDEDIRNGDADRANNLLLRRERGASASLREFLTASSTAATSAAAASSFAALKRTPAICVAPYLTAPRMISPEFLIGD